MKVCNICKEEKPLSNFHYSKNNKDKLKHICSSCTKELERVRWNNLPQKVRRAKWLKTKYKISYDDYEKIYHNQNGECKLCNIPISITSTKNNHQIACVDHDHKTGIIRGLLCNHCNRALGLLKDNLDVVSKISKYLKGESF